MVKLDINRLVAGDDMSKVHHLLSAVERLDGRRPLSDHLWIDLQQGGRPGFTGLLAWQSGHDDAVAYCQVSRGNDSWSLDLIVHPLHRFEMTTIGLKLLTEAIRIVADEGGGHVHWWVFEPTEIHARLAKSINFLPGRSMQQMQVALPLATEIITSVPMITTQAFQVGIDDQQWLDVNNRAFLAHPEQGGWTTDIFQARQLEPWFNPSGFLLHYINNKLAGFCWTKMHLDTNPGLGEIYVIAVDPQYAGEGLGRALSVAGLRHLTNAGATTGMLFVDTANTRAVSMYNDLGFTTQNVQRAFVGDIGAAIK